MSNLIITLISIALVAAVAVAALYNGGDAFRQGSAKASSAQLINAAQQITAANLLYANNNGGSYASSLNQLTSGGTYLQSTPRVPEGFSINPAISSNIIRIQNATGTDASDSICKAVNKTSGYGENILAEESDVDRSFGCYGTAKAISNFVFKG